ncbi:MAG TPA: hypothetical protein VF669_01590, partial [Tepidisphaeraceae bacterium]
MRRICLLCVLFCASGAWADQIIFKNGDKLTGTIKSASGGKVTIETAMAGTVVADLSNIQSLSTKEPVTIRTEDGKESKQALTAAEPGKVALQGGTVPLEQIKWI